jgi:hypothetical protein
MADTPAALARPLRVVLVWHGEPLEEKVLHAAAPVVLGSRKGVTFAVPEAALGAEYTLLKPSADGSFTLCLASGMSGTLGLDRREIAVEEFLAQSRGGGGHVEQPLSVHDWGVVALDHSQHIAIFFQFLPTSLGLGPGAGFLDRFIGQALVFSAVVHITLLAIAFILWEPEDSLDIDPPPSTAIAKLLVEAPPEPEKKEKPDIRKAREDDASKKAAKKEGKIGDKDAKVEKTKIPKGDRDQIAKAVSNMGLLGNLKQGKQSAALKSLLSDTPDATITTAMAGLKGTELVVGRGSGGMGLKGEGPGGGGTGKGQLMGVGNLAVGGGGKGNKNTGTGGGGTRVVKEVHVGMTTGPFSSEGGLSKAQVDAVVRAHSAAIRFCYEKELQRFPHLSGTVQLAWRIEADGHVGTVRVGNTTLGNPSAEGCMSRQVKAWVFPKSNGVTNVADYPFVFRGQ